MSGGTNVSSSLREAAEISLARKRRRPRDTPLTRQDEMRIGRELQREDTLSLRPSKGAAGASRASSPDNWLEVRAACQPLPLLRCRVIADVHPPRPGLNRRNG